MSAKRCCVPNCNKTREGGCILHVFPNPDKDFNRFEMWIKTIGGELLILDHDIVFKRRKVCHSHFEPQHYTHNRRLSRAAVPTLHLEDDTSSHVAADIKLEGTVTNEDICIEHGDLLDNSHTMEDTVLKHDISLKIEKIVPERINLEHFKIDDSFINEEVYIKSEVTVKEEDITEDSVMSDNRHTMQNTELEHDIHLKPVKIVSERIDLEESETDDSFLNVAADIKLEGTVTNEDICIEHGDILDNSHTMEDTELKHDISLKIEKIVPERINLEHFKIDDSFTNEEVHIKSEVTVKEEDITEDSVMSHISHTMHTTELEHDIHLKPVKIVFERIDSEEFETGRIAAKKPKKLRNVNTDTGGNLYMCNVCEKSYARKRQLIEHIQTHTGDKPYVCNICEKSFIRKTHLDGHIRIHSGERPHRCNLCEKSFIRKSYLAIHTRIHTGEKPYRCNICEKSFMYKSHFVAHMRIHTGERPYKCNVCEKNFTSKGTLNIHTLKHTGERPYRCNVCGINFARKDRLAIHTLKHTDERPYGCNECGIKFARKERLAIHTRKHTYERSYKCNVCGRNFAEKRDLQRHGRVHSDVKPHKCNICEKSFYQKSTLASHTLVHTGKKPYGCNVCKRSFAQKDSLVIHMFKTHSA